MKVLIIKTSSLGDIIHTLPAITDAARHRPDIEFDWVVEEAFTEIPAWHPNVKNIIPFALRRWRKNIVASFKNREPQKFIKQLRATHYDLIIDAQGLIKSALICRLARGMRCGLNYDSAWEPCASFAYQKAVAVNPNQHAIDRVRQLFANIFNYTINPSNIDYGVDVDRLPKKINFTIPTDPFLIFLHGTTWRSKHWPEQYWRELITMANQSGYKVLLPWGNADEQQRAERLSQQQTNAVVLPRLSLMEIAALLIKARAVVSVDTGLGHLAASLNIPTVSLYGPTDPEQTGMRGHNQITLKANFACAPCLNADCNYTQANAVKPACFSTLPPALVWEKLRGALS